MAVEDGSSSSVFYLLGLFALSAIAVFRRELSPNHRFAEEQTAAVVSGSTAGSKQEKELDWNEIETLLEWTGQEFGASLLTVWMRLLHLLRSRHDHEGAAAAGAVRPDEPCKVGEDLWKVLPNDVQVQILTFLHPRDVLSLATVSQSCRALNESRTLWKRLWFRDYAWIMTCWGPGREALERSGVSLQEFDDYSASFYLCFAYCYLSYVLASHNTTKSCLVGLGGHVYDLTSFLPAHPGSQETVLVHAGRCATDFFAGVRHSFTAQKLAQKLCIIVDTGKHHGQDASGLRPTTGTKLVESPYICLNSLPKALAPSTTDFASSTRAAVAHVSKAPSSSNSPAEIRAELRHQEMIAKEIAIQRYAQLSPFHDCHVYLDPFCCQWKAWYTDYSFVNVFVDL